MDYIDTIKHVMEELKISQRKLANLVGVSNQWINFCLKRTYKFTGKMRIRIANALADCIDERVSVHQREIDQLHGLKCELGAAIDDLFT